MTTKNAYLDATPLQKKVTHEHLCGILAILRAQEMSYQTSHWQASGLSYYGNHLLFQRLYESVGAEIDGIAEKMVGYLGSESVNLAPQAVKVATVAVGWAKIECPFHRGLASEKQLQAAIKAAYDGIKEAKAMTLGLDDFLMAMSNAHDTNAYLLQQVMAAPPARVAALVERRFKAAPPIAKNAHTVGEPKAPRPVAPNAKDEFYDNPRFYETHDFAQSGAISNSEVVAIHAAPELGIPLKKELKKVEQAPVTTGEILSQPGGEQFGTLNRLVVKTEDPDGKQAAQKAPRWTFAPR
jgi:DNA-binding ferritin-like protein